MDEVEIRPKLIKFIIDFPITEDYAKVLSPIFIRHLKYYSLLSVDSVDAKTNRLSFIVTFKARRKLLTFKKDREVFDDALTPKSALLSELQKVKYITNVKVSFHYLK